MDRIAYYVDEITKLVGIALCEIANTSEKRGREQQAKTDMSTLQGAISEIDELRERVRSLEHLVFDNPAHKKAVNAPKGI